MRVAVLACPLWMRVEVVAKQQGELLVEATGSAYVDVGATVARLLAEVALGQLGIGGPPHESAVLEQVSDPSGWGEGMSLRWVLLHLINETARHAGHADATRELLDGSTGE